MLLSIHKVQKENRKVSNQSGRHLKKKLKQKITKIMIFAGWRRHFKIA